MYGYYLPIVKSFFIFLTNLETVQIVRSLSYLVYFHYLCTWPKYSISCICISYPYVHTSEIFPANIHAPASIKKEHPYHLTEMKKARTIMNGLYFYKWIRLMFRHTGSLKQLNIARINIFRQTL